MAHGKKDRWVFALRSALSTTVVPVDGVGLTPCAGLLRGAESHACEHSSQHIWHTKKAAPETAAAGTPISLRGRRSQRPENRGMVGNWVEGVITSVSAWIERPSQTVLVIAHKCSPSRTVIKCGQDQQSQRRAHHPNRIEALFWRGTRHGRTRRCPCELNGEAPQHTQSATQLTHTHSTRALCSRATAVASIDGLACSVDTWYDAGGLPSACDC